MVDDNVDTSFIRLTRQYNDGIPADSRLANHSEEFKNAVESLQMEEGLTKIRKVKELTKLAEGGTSHSRLHPTTLFIN